MVNRCHFAVRLGNSGFSHAPTVRRGMVSAALDLAVIVEVLLQRSLGSSNRGGVGRLPFRAVSEAVPGLGKREGRGKKRFDRISMAKLPANCSDPLRSRNDRLHGLSEILQRRVRGHAPLWSERVALNREIAAGNDRSIVLGIEFIDFAFQPANQYLLDAFLSESLNSLVCVKRTDPEFRAVRRSFAYGHCAESLSGKACAQREG